MDLVFWSHVNTAHLVVQVGAIFVGAIFVGAIFVGAIFVGAIFVNETLVSMKVRSRRAGQWYGKKRLMYADRKVEGTWRRFRA